LTPESGIRDGEKFRSGMNIPDENSVKKKPKSFDADLDPGSGIRNGKIRIRDKHPGNATLLQISSSG
jgi:hypothetical protein